MGLCVGLIEAPLEYLKNFKNHSEAIKGLEMFLEIRIHNYGSVETYTKPLHESTLKLEMPKSASARVDARARRRQFVNSVLSSLSYQLLAIS